MVITGWYQNDLTRWYFKRIIFCLSDFIDESKKLDEKVLYILIKEKLRYNAENYNYFNVGYAVDFVINPNQVVFSSFLDHLAKLIWS